MKYSLLASTCLFLALQPLVGQSAGGGASAAPSPQLAYTRCDSKTPFVVANGSYFEADFAIGNFRPVSSYVRFVAVVGHSYAVEAWDPTDATDTEAFLHLLDANCSPGPAFTNVAAIDPWDTFGFGDRISWIQPFFTSAMNIAFTKTDGLHAYRYKLRVVDTTLHNPYWNTNPGFLTQYVFLNTTGHDISGVLTLTDSTGGNVRSAVSLIIPAGSQLIEVIAPSNASPGLQVPAGHSGFADFAFIGPPGAISAEAYFLNLSSGTITRSSFNPRDDQH